MLRFTFVVDGVTQLDRALSRYGDAVKDMRPAFKRIAKDFLRIETEQFKTEGGHGGDKWAALSANYAEWKMMVFGGTRILEATGELVDSLTGSHDKNIEQISKDNLVVGTSVSYAIYHQRSTDRMPVRPVINLSEEDKRGWMHILHDFAFDEAKKAGLR